MVLGLGMGISLGKKPCQRMSKKRCMRWENYKYKGCLIQNFSICVFKKTYLRSKGGIMPSVNLSWKEKKPNRSWLWKLGFNVNIHQQSAHPLFLWHPSAMCTATMWSCEIFMAVDNKNNNKSAHYKCWRAIVPSMSPPMTVKQKWAIG